MRMFRPMKITIDEQLNKKFQSACEFLKTVKLKNQYSYNQLNSYSPQVLYQKELKNFLDNVEYSFKHYQKTKTEYEIMRKEAINILIHCNIIQRNVALSNQQLIQYIPAATIMIKQSSKGANEFAYFRNTLTLIKQATKQKWKEYQNKMRLSPLQKKDQELLKQIALIKLNSQSKDFQTLYENQFVSTKKITELFDCIRFEGITLKAKQMIKQIPNKSLMGNVELLIDYLEGYCLFYNRQGNPFVKFIDELSNSQTTAERIQLVFNLLPRAVQKIMKPLANQILSIKLQNTKLKNDLNKPRINPLTELQKKNNQKKVLDLQVQNSKFESQVKQLKIKITQLSTELKEAQTKAKKSQNVQSPYSMGKNYIYTSPSRNSVEQQKLRKQLQQYKLSYQQSLKRIEAVQKQNKLLVNQKNELQERIKDLQELKQQRQDQNKVLKYNLFSQRQKLQKQKEAISNQKKRIQNLLNQVQQRLGSINKQIQIQRTKNKKLQSSLQGKSNVKNQISIVQQQIEKERQDYRSLFEDYSKLKQTLQKQYQSKLNQPRINLKTLQKINKQLLNLSKQQEQENKKILGQLTTLHQKCAQLEKITRVNPVKSPDEIVLQPQADKINISFEDKEINQLRNEIKERDRMIETIKQFNSRTLRAKEEKLAQLQMTVISLKQKLTSNNSEGINEEERIE